MRCEGVPASTGVGVKVGVCKDRGGSKVGVRREGDMSLYYTAIIGKVETHAIRKR